MNISEIIITGLGLAMDAFSVSMCKSLSLKKFSIKNAFKCAIYFSVFQMLMPLLGYYLGNTFTSIIVSIDHWICFIILFYIGINMIKDSNNSDDNNNLLDFKTMIVLAIATSIDAFAVGITFSFLNVSIFLSIIIIGIVTFITCFFGFIFANYIGKYFNKSNIFGGIILIIIGLKILISHLL